MPLVILAHVKKTKVLEAVWEALIPFVPEDMQVTVTSGLRMPTDQLRIIGGYAAQHGLIQPEFDISDADSKMQIDDVWLYLWQRTWSKLLVYKPTPIIINPPYDASCTEHYINSAGVDMFGKIIRQSPHTRGHAFDVRGMDDYNDVQDEMALKTEMIKAAMQAGVAIKGYKVERGNNCLHIDCL